MKILRTLHGGFGRIEILKNGDLLARKVFDPPKTLYTDAELVKLKRRFAREVKIQSQLSSEYFIPIISHDLISDTPCFIMPFAKSNFADEIARCKANNEIPIEALADILNSLEELHSLGYVHRDLKPHNILLHEGKWKLSDFGLVLPPSGTTTKLTSEDSGWGTMLYCAPEQLAEFRNVDQTADIYSFGCIMHDIFGSEPRIPLQQHSAKGRIGMVIEKCTEIQPKKRFKSIGAIRSLLVQSLDEIQGLAVSPSAEGWLADLASISEWNLGKLEEFTHFIKHLDRNEDRFALFSVLDEEMLQGLIAIEFELWKVIVLEYCQWIMQASFNFARCDVLIRRILLIYNQGDVECKAACAIAGAELGRSHNRWHVMEQILAMCSPKLDDKIAERIAIEIVAEDAQRNFIACAKIIQKTLDSYHPYIQKVLIEE